MPSTDPSDWDPLPDDEVGLHPGEAPLPPPAAQAALATVPAGNGYGEAGVLRALQGGREPVAVLCAAPRHGAVPGMRSEMRERREVHARSAGPAGTGPAVQADHDPREDQSWFRQLPADEQRRMREAWCAQQERRSHEPDQRRRELLERFWFAYVVFFVAALPLMLFGGLDVFVRMAMAGCVTGVVWQVLPRRRRWCSGSAVAVYAAVIVLPQARVLVGQWFESLVALGGAVVVGYLGGLGALHGAAGRRG